MPVKVAPPSITHAAATVAGPGRRLVDIARNDGWYAVFGRENGRPFVPNLLRPVIAGGQVSRIEVVNGLPSPLVSSLTLRQPHELAPGPGGAICAERHRISEKAPEFLLRNTVGIPPGVQRFRPRPQHHDEWGEVLEVTG